MTSAADAFAASASRDVVLVLIDLVDSTSLIQTLGDRRASVVLGRFYASVRALSDATGGREIDHSDGFLLLFDGVPEALAMALALQRDLASFNAANAVELAARIGIHSGPAVLTDNDSAAVARGAKPLEVEGLAKVICARICALAGPRQILLSQAAFEQAQRGSVPADAVALRWLEHGFYLLQGIDEPQAVHEIGYVGEAALRRPVDVAKAHLLRDDDRIIGWRAGIRQEIPTRPGWTLERKLGSGGYGDAWLARDAASGAARVFKFCYTRSRVRSLQREVALFRLMQRALGDRDDIARILDWQLDAPPWFIESEFSAEGDLETWCASEGGVASVPLAMRLELIAQVADALAAAHAIGVLHKDVKPSNVLIHRDAAGAPRARLADFGIGAVSASSRYRYGEGMIATGMTEILVGTEGTRSSGTRMYLAPEQIEGREATTHADIYALGILLYQSVVGDFTKSLAPGWEDDIADPLLREAIAETIARDPAQRTGNLEAFAQRLRTLDARRAERRAARAEELRAARRRRLRRWLVPAFGVLVALFAGLLVMLQKISHEAERANREAAAAQAVTEFIINLLEQADPLHARGEDITVREVMDRGIEKANSELAAQPEIRARLLAALGRVHLSLGRYADAERALETAWRVDGGLPDTDPAARAQLRIALVDARSAMGRYASAIALGRDALADADARAGAASLAAADAHSALGAVLNAHGDYPAAADHLARARAIFALHRPAHDRDWAEATRMLAENHIKEQRRDDAIVLLESTLDARIDDLDRVDILSALGGALREEGRLREGLARFEAAAGILRRYKLTEYGEYAGALFNIGSIHALLGELEPARAAFAGALAVHRATYGERPYWAYALSLKALGGTLQNLGRHAEAEPLLRQAMAQYEAMQKDVDVARLLGMVALAEVATGKRDAGLRDGYIARERLDATVREDPDNLYAWQSQVENLLTLAHAQHLAGQHDAARALCTSFLLGVGTRLDYPSIYNDVRRAKLNLCADRAAAAAPILARLDQLGYRDAWLDLLRGR